MEIRSGSLHDRFVADVLKMGRTQLQDAVPMTLGQEFGSYATMPAEDWARLGEALLLLHEVNLGATAIGIRLSAPPGYRDVAVARLAALTGVPWSAARTWSRPPRTAGRSCTCPACSSGYDVTVTVAAEGGQLQLNAFEPASPGSRRTSGGCAPTCTRRPAWPAR